MHKGCHEHGCGDEIFTAQGIKDVGVGMNVRVMLDSSHCLVYEVSFCNTIFRVRFKVIIRKLPPQFDTFTGLVLIRKKFISLKLINIKKIPPLMINKY